MGPAGVVDAARSPCVESWCERGHPLGDGRSGARREPHLIQPGVAQPDNAVVGVFDMAARGAMGIEVAMRHRRVVAVPLVDVLRRNQRAERQEQHQRPAHRGAAERATHGAIIPVAVGPSQMTASLVQRTDRQMGAIDE
jgi:hypothetical protein